VKYRAWILRPHRDGGSGLIVLAPMICRLKVARYILWLARVMAELSIRWWK
jgi:hypothetical protein